jgi:hypothetical protein
MTKKIAIRSCAEKNTGWHLAVYWEAWLLWGMIFENWSKVNLSQFLPMSSARKFVDVSVDSFIHPSIKFPNQKTLEQHLSSQSVSNLL